MKPISHIAVPLAAALSAACALATAAGNAIVPTWTKTRQITVGRAPVYFAYKDPIPDGPDRDAESDRRFTAWRAKLVEEGWFCERIVHFTDGLASIVFSDLPSGSSRFDIRCKGDCRDLKYAVAAGADTYISHSGRGEDFVTVGTAGSTNFLLKTNLGFAFLLDDPGAPANVVSRTNPAPALPSGTEVTVIHWRSGLLSSLGGRDCE